MTKLSFGVNNKNVFTNTQTSTGTLVAVGGASTSAASSTDGTTWTLRTMPASVGWYSVASGGGTFVAVAGSANITTAASSTDGVTWTLRTMPAAASWYSVTYGSNLFVAISSGSTTAASSTDGITWTLRTMASSQTWRSVSYGGGSYVAVAAGLVTAAASSTDGVTWTTRTMPSAAWMASAYGNGVFVATSTTSSAASSTDGITWTLRTMPANTLWYGVAYGNGVFASVNGNNITTAASSTDGITWTLRTAPASFWYGVGFGNGVFVTVSQTASSAAISTDGTTWTSVTMPASPTWYAATGSTGGLTNESYLQISNTESYYLSGLASNIQNQINAKAINASPTLTNVNLSSVLNFTLSSPYSTNLQKFFGVTQQPIGSTTYTVSEYDRFLVFNTTAACTVTLPAAASFSGREITLKQIAAFAVNSASSNVQPLTSVTAGTAILTGAGKYAVLVSNGTNWIVVRSN